MFFKKKVNYSAFGTGKLLPLDQVPDPVFSEKMMGDGFAIDITEPEIIAPIDGEITLVFPTKHAVGIKTKEGIEILLHIGMDTVELEGEGFNSFVNVGDKVKQGEVLLKVDLAFVKSKGKSLISPMIFTSGQAITLTKKENVKAGEQNILDMK